MRTGAHILPVRPFRLVRQPVSCLLLIAFAGADAQSTDTRGAFVLRLGQDTLSVEQYARRGNRLEGDLVARVPKTVRVRYAVEFTREGVRRSRARIESLGLETATAVAREVTLDFLGDSIRVTVDSGAMHRVEMRRGGVGAVPLTAGPYATSYATYEWLLARARAGDTTSVPFVSPLTLRLGRATYVRLSPRRAAIDFFGEGFMPVDLDAQGRLMAVDANGITVRVNAERVRHLDIDRLARRFAALDLAGRSIGVASPPDSVRATVAGVRVGIDYGSPRMRGRRILGALVPYDTVWRTGANAATLFRIDGDLAVGGVRVPAGTYSLWTVPHHAGAELILNAQHGQWGTEYDRTRDVVRVPLRVTVVSTDQEHFAIDVTPDGEMRFRWSTFVWTARLGAP